GQGGGGVRAWGGSGAGGARRRAAGGVQRDESGRRGARIGDAGLPAHPDGDGQGGVRGRCRRVRADVRGHREGLLRGGGDRDRDRQGGGRGGGRPAHLRGG